MVCLHLCSLPTHVDFGVTSVCLAGKQLGLCCTQIDELPEPHTGLSADQLVLFADILCAGML